MTKDRYTRLKAIKEFGYDIDWKELKKKHVGIIGIGGLGCVSSEMVVRCGVGKLTLFDFDTVDIVNLNRNMFRIEHIGRPKVEVAAEVLNDINSDVEISFYNHDILDSNFELEFEKEISQFDIILNGLDNISAREYLNIKCIRLNIPYIDAGASRSGLSGYVHPVIPYKTACAKCIGSLGINFPKERGEPCVASLPSTMAILASIQIQEMLKFFFKIGEMIDYLMYNMLSGKFLSYKTARDENCNVCGKVRFQGHSQQVKSKISQDELDELIENIKDPGV